jgi:hypothetical protein
VLAIRPVTLLVKIPVPLPSIVFVVKETVGLTAVLQQTPLVVTGESPSVNILPPEVNEVLVRFDMAVVVREGIIATALVVNVRSLPYPEPEEFVAYARI